MSAGHGTGGVSASPVGAVGRPGSRVATAARWFDTGVRGMVLRAAALVPAAVGAAWVHEHHDPGVLCPLRRLTGIPCPFCGSTTVFMEAGAGHPLGAFAANPLAVVGVFGLVLAPVGLAARWAALPRQVRSVVLVTAVLGSWLWQLHRFAVLP